MDLKRWAKGELPIFMFTRHIQLRTAKNKETNVSKIRKQDKSTKITVSLILW